MRMIQILLTCILILITGCTNNDQILLKVSDNSHLTSGMTEVELINNSSSTVVTGYDYTIEFYNNDEWEEIPLVLIFDDIDIHVSSNESYQFNIHLYPDQHQYQPGEYRIRKKTSIEGQEKELFA